MPRQNLFSLRLGHALRESLAEGYGRAELLRDVLAGASVGVIAIPLAMALAIASGVAPQYGLYTAIVAGLVIALAGGSRFSISGPTAAFVVILYPVSQQFGLAGLLIATVMAGVILIAMGLLRLGRMIEYIPEAVTLGFTGGIAIVIAILQLRDFLGLELAELPAHNPGKVVALVQHLPTLRWQEAAVGGFTLAVMLGWRRMISTVPPYLPAVILAALLGWWLTTLGFEVETIASRFSYTAADGSEGRGIPPLPPTPALPWTLPGPGGEPLTVSWGLIIALLPSALAIAMLGAIESLLCAMVLDGMSGRRHSPNSELLGQGIGNVVAPFFGGITATAALARSAVNFRAGARSPLSGAVHALVVLLGLVALAPLLSLLPMAAMAALLLMVAWNMSEADKALHLLRRAPGADVTVFLVCLSLTVLFDMVIAIAVGIVLASLLFMKTIAEMTRVRDITAVRKHVPEDLPQHWRVFKLSGPLFFAAADRIFDEMIAGLEDARGVVLYMDGVPILDAGGLSGLRRFLWECRRRDIAVHIADLQFQPLKAVSRAQLFPVPGELTFHPTLSAALDDIRSDIR